MVYFPEHKIALAIQANSSVPRAVGKSPFRFWSSRPKRSQKETEVKRASKHKLNPLRLKFSLCAFLRKSFVSRWRCKVKT